jgi:hypothetical protein
MKKFIALALLVGAALVLPTMAAALGEDAKGPACLDITGGSALYTGGTLSLTADLATAPCKFVTYTLYVYDDENMGTPLATQTDYVSLNDTTIGLAATPGDTDGVVCVAMTTSIGKHVFDRAPDSDSDCILVSSTPPGFGGFR